MNEDNPIVDRWDRVEQLFGEALELPEEARAQFLDRVCADDPSLRACITILLGAHISADDSWDDLRKPMEMSFRMPAPGARIAGYRIHRVIGSGGMGAVYEAEQERPARRVALKVMRPGAMTPALLRRFQHESDLLARLSHPGIAQVYEAGVFDDGAVRTPYFAMELVEDAQTIVEHASERELDRTKRLDLFVQACEAVQHGHQRGVIHRDLKPANVLIDARGEPKIIDFGVARAVESDVALSMQTCIGQLIGTIAYMSPEQCAADPREIDTRSDVYALGVILYELLCGRLPYDIEGKTITEALRIVQTAPPRRMTSQDDPLPTDVQAIVFKALEKQKSRRYQSAAELGGDIRRFLRHQPVDARPPSALYHARLFARRNRTLVVAIGVVSCSLVAASIISAGFAFQATQAANAESEQRATAEEVTAFLRTMIAAADPAAMQGRDVRLVELLDIANEQLEQTPITRPLAEASIREALGDVARKHGRLDEAESHQRRALAIRMTHFGEWHEETLGLMNSLALTLNDRGEYEAAIEWYSRAIEGFRATLGPDHERTLMLTNNLGWYFLTRNEPARAEPYFERALDARRRMSGEDHLETIRTKINLSAALMDQSRFAEAEPLSLTALADAERLFGAMDPMTIYALNRAARCLQGLGGLEETERIARQSLERSERTFGDSHSYTYFATSTLARILDDLANWDEAETLYRRTLDGRRQALGDEHADTALALNDLGIFLWYRERHDEAEPLLRAVYDQRRSFYGADHPVTLDALTNLGLLELGRGDAAEAEAILREIGERIPTGDVERRINVSHNLGSALRELNRLDEAEPLLAFDATEVAERWPEDRRRLAAYRRVWGVALRQLNQTAKAEAVLRASFDDFKVAYGESNPRTIAAMEHLVDFYESTGELDDAALWRDRIDVVTSTERGAGRP